MLQLEAESFRGDHNVQVRLRSQETERKAGSSPFVVGVGVGGAGSWDSAVLLAGLSTERGSENLWNLGTRIPAVLVHGFVASSGFRPGERGGTREGECFGSDRCAMSAMTRCIFGLHKRLVSC
jgi:hypothetical protein